MMIVRPDWLRRKHLFSATVIAIAAVLLVNAGSKSGPVNSSPKGLAGDRAAGAWRAWTTPGNGFTVQTYDPWRPYVAPVISEPAQAGR